MVLFKPEHLTEILHAVSVTPPLPLTGIILSVSTAFAFRGQLRETIVQIISYILNVSGFCLSCEFGASRETLA